MKLGHILIGGIVVLYVFVFYVNYMFPPPDIVLQDFELDAYFLITNEGSNPGAPVVLVEFIDYQCPFCLQMHGDIKKLLERYGANINYVVRHLPSKERPFSLRSAEAVECAKDEGKFFSYHNKLLEEGVSSLDDLYNYGAELGFGEEFRLCLQSRIKLQIIENHVKEASSHNVKGTPTFFLNGQKLQGGQEYATFVALTEAVLDEME